MTALRFTFKQPAEREDVEADATFALFAAGCVYGRPRLRLEASYLVADDGSSCVLRTDGEAGEAAARIFVELTALRLGDGAFRVEKLERATVEEANHEV